MTPWKIWLFVAAACVIIEILPPPTHFFFLCVGFGALAASIAAFFSGIYWLPWVVFAVVTAALTPMLVPLAKFLFTPKFHPSNVDELIGQRALVLEDIQPHAPGMVKIRGETWRARADGETIPKESWVTVERVEGTHLVVRRVS